MEYQLDSSSNGITLRLTGRFDVQAGFDFFAIATKAMRMPPAKGLDIDLAGVEYIDSSGIGKLLHIHRQLSEEGRRLCLVNASPAVRRALLTLGVDKIVTVA